MDAIYVMHARAALKVVRMCFGACTEDVLRARRAVQAVVSSQLRVSVSADETQVRVVGPILRRPVHTGSVVDARSTLGSTVDAQNDRRRCSCAITLDLLSATVSLSIDMRCESQSVVRPWARFTKYLTIVRKSYNRLMTDV